MYIRPFSNITRCAGSEANIKNKQFESAGSEVNIKNKQFETIE